MKPLRVVTIKELWIRVAFVVTACVLVYTAE